MNRRALVPRCLASVLLAAPAVAQVTGSCVVSAYEPGAGPGRLFGDAVSVAGRRAVVLAPGYYAGPGAAYVYDTESFGEPLAVLEPSDGAAGYGLGGGVAIEGGTVVAGSRFDRPGGVPTGSAYVFEARGARWVEVAKLVPSLAPRRGRQQLRHHRRDRERRPRRRRPERIALDTLRDGVRVRAR